MTDNKKDVDDCNKQVCSEPDTKRFTDLRIAEVLSAKEMHEKHGSKGKSHNPSSEGCMCGCFFSCAGAPKSKRK